MGEYRMEDTTPGFEWLSSPPATQAWRSGFGASAPRGGRCRACRGEFGGSSMAVAFSRAISALSAAKPAADRGFVRKRPYCGELVLHLAQQLERGRQQGVLLALRQLLHPPHRVVFLIHVRQRLAGARQVVEGALFLGDTDLRFDPRFPVVPGGLRCVMVSALLDRAAVYHPVAEQEERQAAAMDTFATPRLKATKIAREDLPDLVQLHLDGEVSRFLGGVRTPSVTAAYLETSLRHWADHGIGLWTLRTGDGTLVGRAGLRHVALEGVPEWKSPTPSCAAPGGKALPARSPGRWWRLGKAMRRASLVGLVMKGNLASERVLGEGRLLLRARRRLSR